MKTAIFRGVSERFWNEAFDVRKASRKDVLSTGEGQKRMRLTLETGTTRVARPLPACSPSGWGTPPGAAWRGRLRFRSGSACLGLAIGRSLFPGALLLDEPFAARGDRLGGQGLGVWYAVLAPIRPRVQAMLLQMASGEPLQRCPTFQARDAVGSNTGLPREHGGHR